MNDALDLLRRVVDLGEERSFLVSLTGQLLHVSTAMRSCLDVTLEQALAQPLDRFYSEETFVLLRKTALPAVSRNGHWEGEGQLRSLENAALLPARIRVALVRSPRSEQPVCLMIQHHLDEDRRRAEEAESLRAALLESSLDPIVLVNHEGRIVEFSRAAEKCFGYRRSQVLGKKPEEVLFPPAADEMPHERVERHLSTREGSMLGRRTEVVGRRANGESFSAEMAMTISYVSGQPIFAFFLRDISERKQAEASLRESEARLQSILDNTPAVVYVKSLDGRYQMVNRAFENLFDLGRDGLVGLFDHEVFPAVMADAFRANDVKVREAAAPLVFEEVAPHGDGPHTYVSVKFPLFDASGAVHAVCGISTDITQRIAVEAALRQAKDAAEAASRAKSLFLANMSHEIRTPMNAIIGLTELVLDSVTSPEHREYLTMVRDSGQSLLTVINDILDFSKIEAGKLDLEHVVFDPREMLGDAMKSLAFRAHGKGLELACHIAPDVPDVLQGDPARLRQTIVNLVGNAIKFTQRGQVDLDVCRQSADAEHVVLHFAVRDTGVGIPLDKQELIFGAFEQADSSMTRRFGGTGLGLTISRSLVELMGGQIWLDSQLNRGSTFHFTARFGLASARDLPGGAGSQGLLADVRVLVVDDNATTRFILEEMLRNWQMAPSVACDAAGGLAQLTLAEKSGAPFPLLLVDAHMPEEDGFALVRNARQRLSRLGAVIMMLSSGDLPTDIARCDQAGVAHYLVKPIKQSELLDLLVQIHAQEQGLAAPPCQTAVEPASRLPPLHVLLVEDSPVNQTLALGILKRHGHKAMVANNGKEALAVLATHTFDVVLMDIQMPEMDGLEATAAIRAQEQGTGAHLPIIAMTAHAMKGDRERCLSSGMDGYVAKPVRMGELLEVLEKVLCLTDGDGARKPTVNSAASASSAVEQPRDEILDWDRLLDGMQGDIESIRELASVFEVECQQTLAEIEQALSSADAVTLRRSAHTLQGSARVFAAQPVQNAALRLEQIAAHQQWDQAHAAARELYPLVERLLVALRRHTREVSRPLQ